MGSRSGLGVLSGSMCFRSSKPSHDPNCVVAIVAATVFVGNCLCRRQRPHHHRLRPTIRPRPPGSLVSSGLVASRLAVVEGHRRPRRYRHELSSCMPSSPQKAVLLRAAEAAVGPQAAAARRGQL
jgi:hypothetical protein